MANIRVEVAYATPDLQRIIALELPAGSTVADAITRSQIQTVYPEIDLAKNAVGIFSEQVSLSAILKNGDRVEIYRPLQLDPKTARRLRAAKKS